MNEAEALSALAALSQETRLRMIRALVAAGPEGLGAGDVAAAVGASPSRASFHLTALAEASLVSVRADARRRVYVADFNGLGAMIGYLLHDCCGGHPVVAACCAPR